MNQASYVERRGEIEHYFDRTAAKAWEVLTSNAPVGRIRATVRKGRDEMRHTLLSWLPEDMRGLRLLDAGCGTGALAQEAMLRGAEVLAIDLSPTLVNLARERHAQDLLTNPAFSANGGSIPLGWHAGGVRSPAEGRLRAVRQADRDDRRAGGVIRSRTAPVRFGNGGVRRVTAKKAGTLPSLW